MPSSLLVKLDLLPPHTAGATGEMAVPGPAPTASASAQAVKTLNPRPQASALLAQWHAARANVARQLEALRQALLADPDPRLSRLATIRAFDPGRHVKADLDLALESLVSAQDEQRPARAREVLSAALAWENAVTADPFIPYFEDNPYGIEVSVRQPLTQVLLQVRTAMG